MPYQEEWIDHFNQEAELLYSVLGDQALQIEHIGSTSIPGMAAKSIIDIIVAIPHLIRSSDLILELDSMGYTYKPFDTIPERLYFSKESQPDIRTHHLNLSLEGSDFWINQILFRNQLRKNKLLADEYEQIKRDFFVYYNRTNHVDLEWKSEFVAKVLKIAKDELHTIS
ncbi:MAG: GrpB family protein [Eudoraea sp.]|nr:GrpB family protein [Eudoraea sp.]